MKYVFVPVFARNVLFSKESEELLELLKKRAANPQVAKYVTSSLRKYLINEYPGKEHQEQANDPAYIKQAISRGDTVFDVNFAKEKNKFLHYIDYLNTLPPNKVSKISVPQLAEHVRKWDAQLAKNLGDSAITDEDGISVVGNYDGFTWVNVFGRQSLKKEGDLMGHCVGGDDYYRAVKNGNIKIYSLRDKSNNPHVTVEYDIRDKEIIQVKGKQNKPPVAKYVGSVVAFLESLDVQRADPQDMISMGIYPEQSDDGKIDFINLKKVKSLNIGGEFRLEASETFDLNLNDLTVGELVLDNVNLAVPIVHAQNADIDGCEISAKLIKTELTTAISNSEITQFCELVADELILDAVEAASTLDITADDCHLLDGKYCISGSIDYLYLDQYAKITFADDVQVNHIFNENYSVISESYHPLIVEFGDNNHFKELDITYCSIERIPSGFKADTLYVDLGDLPRQIAKDVSVKRLVLNIYSDINESSLDSIVKHLAKFNCKTVTLVENVSYPDLAEMLESKGLKLSK